MDPIYYFFLDRIYRIDEIFFACGDRPIGQRPLYPEDPVDPVQLPFEDKNPLLFIFDQAGRFSDPAAGLV
jgi:hypothetical protein